MRLFCRAMHFAADWEWVNEQMGVLRVEDTSGIIGIDADTNERVSACIMDNWTRNSVQAHLIIVNSMAIRHGFLEEIFDFMYNVKGVNRIYGLVPGDNVKALKINAHIGFTEKMRLDDAWEEGIDYVVVEMKKENCNYLPKLEAA